MKTRRHEAILRIVRRGGVHSQEQLRKLLKRDGIEVTQATLSRDIRELGLAKVGDPAAGSTYYRVAPEMDTVQPRLEDLASSLIVAVDGVGNLLVVRTPAGSANALGSAIDRARWKEVVGTIAGDDTLLIVARSEKSRRAVADRLSGLAAL